MLYLKNCSKSCIVLALIEKAVQSEMVRTHIQNLRNCEYISIENKVIHWVFRSLEVEVKSRLLCSFVQPATEQLMCFAHTFHMFVLPEPTFVRKQMIAAARQSQWVERTPCWGSVTHLEEVLFAHMASCRENL